MRAPSDTEIKRKISSTIMRRKRASETSFSNNSPFYCQFLGEKAFGCHINIRAIVNLTFTSESVVSSWKICPSPSTCRTQILQLRSTVLTEKRSRVKQQWRFLCEPVHTCWKESSCNRDKGAIKTVFNIVSPVLKTCLIWYFSLIDAKESKTKKYPVVFFPHQWYSSTTCSWWKQKIFRWAILFSVKTGEAQSD